MTDKTTILYSSDLHIETHAVAAIDKHFVADGANSFWAFCITWRPMDKP